MPGSPRRPRPRVIVAAPERFAAGWRLLPDLTFPILPPAPIPPPDLTVDVIRPADLVVLTVEGHGVELVSGKNARIRPKQGGAGQLVVRLAYQHLAERAIYEEATMVPSGDPGQVPPVLVPEVPPLGEPATHVPPIEARPARASRVVLELPEGDEVPFTTEGVLQALGRLPMLVHPLAKPRLGRVRIPPGGPVLHLPNGLIATVGVAGLVVSRAGRGAGAPDPATAAGLSALARDGRRARALLATRAGTSVASVDVGGATGGVSIEVAGGAHEVPGLLGEAGLIRPDVVIRPRARAVLSRPPEPFETAIEAPFRLVISPSASGGWAHAVEPVVAADAEHRIELWHTRLGVRAEAEGGTEVDERPNPQRIVRAVWARDREGPELFEDQADAPFPDWQRLIWPRAIEKPFLSSINGADRHMLVRQSAESWLDVAKEPIPAEPVDVADLWLSALGAWLDLHGEWDTDPFSAAQLRSILLWDHVAPMGRDQFVRVVYPGFLFPFGHSTTLVKLTERKMKEAAPSVAGLFQRKFLVVGEPLRVYGQRDLPFDELRVSPLVTPTLSGNPDESAAFIPMVDDQPFRWVLHCLDKEGRPVRLVTPLLWVPAGLGDAALTAVEALYHGDPISTVSAGGQDVAFADVLEGGDTVAATTQLRFDGTADRVARTTSVPRLRDASVELPAVQHLSPLGALTIEYGATYLAHGFGGSQNAGEVWAEIPAKPKLGFGQGAPSGSDKAGGFLEPNLEIAGLSRLKGTVGDAAEIAKGNFRPEEFLGNALPKLFGLVPLTELLELAGVSLDDAPDVVSGVLDRIEGFLADLERAEQAAHDAVAEAQLLVQRAQSKAAELQQQAQQAVQDAQALETAVTQAVQGILAQLAGLSGAAEAQVQAALAAPLQTLRDATTQMEQVAPQLPPLIREQLRKLATLLRAVTDAADLIEDMVRFLNQLASGATTFTFRYEWSPKLRSWPDPPPNAILELPERALVLSVDGRASQDEMKVDVLAELKDFTLHLLPGEPLVRFRFDHLSFHAGSSGKPDVDVVLQDIEFLGILSFVETLRELIPFDGFSDPPFLDVTSEGLSAGFTLALPNVAVGVFNLSNISLGADVQVPFLGKAVTVGFNFCTRERPFTLAVTFIGGGGWFLIRLSPDGLDVLELGLEAGAILAVDFGVASGSISAMLGIYMRLEGDTGSLSGYFRLRGEVDVLGLISASIELYLELTYQFDTGKMVGKATLTIKVEVFCFSTSVTVSAERRFAGSAGDSSFADMMVLPDGSAPAWSTYCGAFAGE